MKIKSENLWWKQSKTLRVAAQVGVLLAIAPTRSDAAPFDLDMSFNPQLSVDGGYGYVRAVAAQPNGKVLMGGSFTNVNGLIRNKIARLKADGTIDNTFLNNLAGMDADVYAIRVQADGKILIGGQFTNVNAVARKGIARLNEDGSPDTTFLHGQPGPDHRVSTMVLQSDDKIVVGGSFSKVNGVARSGIARLNPDGSLDTAFLDGMAGAAPLSPPYSLHSLALQEDGRLLVGGWFTNFNGAPAPGVVRLNTNGSLDSSFACSLLYQAAVEALAVQDDGKILIGGYFNTVNGVFRAGLARLYADGALDQSFMLTNVDGIVKGIAVREDHRILFGGSWYGGEAGGGHIFGGGLALLHADGSLSDSSTPWDQIAYVESFFCQPDGKVVIGGGFRDVNGAYRQGVARFMGWPVPPKGLLPIQSQTAEIGATVEFTLPATGSAPLIYQWYFNGTNAIYDATTSCSLKLTNVESAHSGTYSAVITNTAGSVTSAPAVLNVILPVPQRPVPGINLMGEIGSSLNLDYSVAVAPAPTWLSLATVSLASPPQFYFDLSAPLPPQRFYRAWQAGAPSMIPALDIHIIPALTLTGSVGSKVRVDGINQFGPTDAWFTLDTVTLTNTSQLYFDVSVIGQPQRLYRLVQMP